MATTRYTVVNGVVLHEDRDGTERLYRPDTLGSTAALQDATTTKATYVYWPYGEIRTSTGSSSTPFKFVGILGYYNDGQRLYVRARHYRPTQGRWMSVDPIGPELHPYSYALDTPGQLTDPFGLFAIAIVPIAIGGILAGILIEIGLAIGIALLVLLAILLLAGILALKAYLCSQIRPLIKRACGAAPKPGLPGIPGPAPCQWCDSCMSLFYKALAFKQCAELTSLETMLCFGGIWDPGHLQRVFDMGLHFGACAFMYATKCSGSLWPPFPSPLGWLGILRMIKHLFGR